MDQFATIERRTLSSLVEQYLQGPKDKRIPRDAHLTKVLDNMGYQYQGNEVGGNCFYLALADQLQKDPAEIRRLLAEWLSHNRNYLAEEGEVDLWNGVMPFLYTDWEDFVNRIGNDWTTWAEWPCLVAASEVFHLNLIILSDQGEGHHVKISPKDQTTSYAVLGHIAEVHYVSVHEKYLASYQQSWILFNNLISMWHMVISFHICF